MKINFKFFLTIIFGVIVYAYIIYLFLHKANIDNFLSVIKKTDVIYLIFGIFLTILMVSVQGYFLQKIFDLYNVKITFKSALTTWLITIPTGVLTAGLSGPAIIFYKAKKEKASSQLAAIITISYFILYMITNLIFASLVGGISIYNAHISLIGKIFLYILFTLIIGFVLLLSDTKIRIKFLKFIERVLPKFLPKIEWDHFLIPSLSKITNIILIGTTAILINMLIFSIAFLAFNIDFHPISIIRNYILAQVLAIFSPTGGGLGFVELGLGSSLTLSGLTITQTGVLVIFFRLFNFWLPALIGLYFLSVKGLDIAKKVN